MKDSNKSQEQRTLWTLQAAWPNEVSALELSKISLQYSRVVFCLRKKGWVITNRLEIVNGQKRGFFRLGPKPVPSSAVLRRSAPSPTSGSLFDLSPETRHRDDG